MNVLLQYSSFASNLPHTTLTSLLHFLHTSLPPYYMTASTEAITGRISELFELWKKQIAMTLSQTSYDTLMIMNEMNSWSPSIPRNGWKCAICEYGNAHQDSFCKVCGSNINDIFTETMRKSTSIKATTEADGSLASTEKTGEKDVLELDADEDEDIYRSWIFNQTLLYSSDSPISIIGKSSYVPATIDGKTKMILYLPQSSYLKITQPFGCNGNGTYLNVYSLILDIMIPHFSQQQYTSILQTDKDNKLPASLFVQQNGAIGCIAYSQPNTIRPDVFHRIVITVDLPNGRILWYVDGQLTGQLVHNQEQRCFVIEDDRWALDSEFLIGADCQLNCQSDIFISAIQLRSSCLTSSEVSRLGCVTYDGPAKPDKADLTDLLMNTTKFPYSFCCIGITESKSRSIQVITNWIKANEKNIIKILTKDAKSLIKLGYKQEDVVLALLASSSRTDAIARIMAKSLGELNKTSLKSYITQINQGLAENESDQGKLHHPGQFVDGVWTCCLNQGQNCPPCTMSYGRIEGIIAKNYRVSRGPHWKWGEQDGGIGCFGTVDSVTNWDIYPSKGVIVHWDNGFYGKYRWGVNNCYDLYIICESSNSRTLLSLNSIGGDSGLENPSYEILKTAALEEKKDKGINDVLPALDNLEEEEIFKELSMVYVRLCSNYSQLSLVSFINVTTASSAVNEDMGEMDVPIDIEEITEALTKETKFDIKDIFMQENHDTLREFITAFLRNSTLSTDTTNMSGITILKNQLDSYLKQEIESASRLHKQSIDKPDHNAILYDFWKNSFANKYTVDLLNEISMLAEPKGSSGIYTLPLAPCSNYTLVATLPEHNISFWNPQASDCFTFCTVMKSSSGQSINTPPTFTTSVLPISSIPLLKSSAQYVSRPSKIELICTIESLSAGKVSFWRLLCPIGFVSFGCIVTKGNEVPQCDKYICISKKIAHLGRVEKNLSANAKVYSILLYLLF